MKEVRIDVLQGRQGANVHATAQARMREKRCDTGGARRMTRAKDAGRSAWAKANGLQTSHATAICGAAQTSGGWPR